MDTIALPSVAVQQRNATCHGMLHPSPYVDAMCVNTAIEISVFDYSVAVRSANGAIVDYVFDTVFIKE